MALNARRIYNMMHHVCITGVLLSLFCFVGVADAGNERPQYALIDIGTLGGTFVRAFDINNYGMVTGESFLPVEDYHAILWHNGHMLDIHTMGDDSYGWGINDSCEIVGGFDPPDAFERAFLWKEGLMYDLGTLGGRDSFAQAINNAGVAVGDSYMYGDNYFHAFLWKNGSMIDLGALETDWGSQAWDINNKGYIVGWSEYYDVYSYKRAVLWTPTGVIYDLGTLGDGDSKAYGINDLGQIVGYSDEPILLGEPHAFIWENGVMYDIHEDYGDFDISIAASINNLTQVVGSLDQGGGEASPFVWTHESGMVPLNILLPPRIQWNLNHARSINDLGQIVGDGYRGGGWHEPHGYIATPVYPSFDLTEISPGIAGALNTVQAFNVEPGTKVYFVWGRHGGGELIPGCDVTINALQIDNPKVAGNAVADEDGVATLEGVIPQKASGATLLLQAVVPGDCAISNLVVQEFE